MWVLSFSSPSLFVFVPSFFLFFFVRLQFFLSHLLLFVCSFFLSCLCLCFCLLSFSLRLLFLFHLFVFVCSFFLSFFCLCVCVFVIPETVMIELVRASWSWVSLVWASLECWNSLRNDIWFVKQEFGLWVQQSVFKICKTSTPSFED